MSRNSDENETNHQFNLSGPGEYKILHGDAPPFKPEKSINIKGVLGAPLAFLLGRGTINQEKTHLLIDNDNGSIRLVLQDTDPLTTHEVTGALTPDKNLKLFGINTEQRWTSKDFVKLARMMRYYFADDAECNRLIADLQTFEGSVTKVFKEHADPGGDATYLLEQKVNGIKMERSFKLKVPLFKGYGAHTFRVEIGFDVSTSRTISLYLYSDDLFVLEPRIREELMFMEVAKFADYTFARVILS